MWKRNDKGEVIRYKARFVAQGFTQRFGIKYTNTYSLVMDATSFHSLIHFTVQRSLCMPLMDVVTTYLYGDLDKGIYMTIPKEFCNSLQLGKFRNPSFKLCKPHYGLKQAGHMWYQHLSQYLLSHGFKNDDICPCIFIKHHLREFVIIAIYVDDLNIIGTSNAIDDVVAMLNYILLGSSNRAPI